MDVYELIKKRRSIRKYRPDPIEWDKVAKILNAGHHAPSAGNLQSWRFIVVKDPETKNKIANAAFNQLWMETAPVHIVICASLSRSSQTYGVRGERLYVVQDCAMAAMSMLLAAESLGLATCFVGAFDEGQLKRDLDIPDNARPQGIITLGHADEKVPAPSRFRLDDLTYFGKYGTRHEEKDLFPVGQHVEPVAAAIEKLKKGRILERLKKKVKKNK
ncbi:nitroreductase family protein [Candidatus Woesearchaeota archaeon]|nr:nitroreductase family protein [Candidatus Woesearchaeota archaeon]